MNKIILLLAFLFLISLVSAQVYKETFNTDSKYGSYEIKDCQGFWKGLDCFLGTNILGTTLVAEYKLESFDNSIIDCLGSGTATLYKEGKLFSGVEFEDINKQLKSLSDVKFYLVINESFEEVVNDYGKVCKNVEIPDNKTINKNITVEVCEDKIIGSHIKIRYREVLQEYNFEVLPIGEYKWILKAKRNINEPLDFILIDGVSGSRLDKWAWWNVNWLAKRSITITGDVKNGFYVLLEKDSDMATNGSDLRIANSSESGEIPFFIEMENVSHFGIWINTTENNTLYVYYKNSSTVSTVSNQASITSLYFKLKAWYQLDNNTDSQQVYVKKDLANGSGTYDVGKVGNSIKGSCIYGQGSAFADLNTQSNTTNTMVCLWTNGSGSGSNAVVGLFDTVGGGIQVNTQIDFAHAGSGSAFQASINNGQANTNFVVARAGWHFNCFTRNFGGVVHYLDGAKVSTTNGAIGGKNKTTLEIVLGANTNACSTSLWTGWLDELAIWDKNLTEAEIIYLNNTPRTYQSLPTYTIGSETTNKVRYVNISYNPSSSDSGNYNENYLLINISIFNFTSVNFSFNGVNETFDYNLTNVFWENKTSLQLDTNNTFFACGISPDNKINCTDKRGYYVLGNGTMTGEDYIPDTSVSLLTLFGINITVNCSGNNCVNTSYNLTVSPVGCVISSGNNYVNIGDMFNDTTNIYELFYTCTFANDYIFSVNISSKFNSVNYSDEITVTSSSGGAYTCDIRSSAVRRDANTVIITVAVLGANGEPEDHDLVSDCTSSDPDEGALPDLSLSNIGIGKYYAEYTNVGSGFCYIQELDDTCGFNKVIWNSGYIDNSTINIPVSQTITGMTCEEVILFGYNDLENKRLVCTVNG